MVFLGKKRGEPATAPPILGRVVAKVFLISVWLPMFFSTFAVANGCLEIIRADGPEGAFWPIQELESLRRTVASFERLGLVGPRSAPGVMFAAVYAKSVAGELQALGSQDAPAALGLASNLSQWVGLFTDGGVNPMFETGLEILASRTTGAARVVERTNALFDRVRQVKGQPDSVQLLIVATEIARNNIAGLVNQERTNEARQIFEKAVSVVGEYFGKIPEAYQLSVGRRGLPK